jgi:hypothetical protein
MTPVDVRSGAPAPLLAQNMSGITADTGSKLFSLAGALRNGFVQGLARPFQVRITRRRILREIQSP